MRTSRERNINSRARSAPRNFSAAGVRLRGITSIPMVITHQIWPWPEDSIYLFGKGDEAEGDSAQVFIHIFPLPEGSRHFQKELKLYLRQKKGFLVDGGKFEPSFLLPATLPRDVKPESFQTRDGAYRRRIVHVLRLPGRAVLLVYSSNSARFASSCFFRQVSECLTIG